MKVNIYSGRNRQFGYQGKGMKKRKDISFEAIFNSADLLLIGVDGEGRIVFFNPACERVSGFRSEEVVGRYFWDFYIPDGERESVMGMLEDFRKGEPVGPMDYLMNTKDGGRRLISWCVGNVDVGKGKPGIAIGVGVDITERRRAREALAISEGFFRMLIENALDLVTVLGPDSRIVYVGPSVERLLGYRQQELIGKSITDFIHPDDATGARKAIDYAMARPGINRYAEVRIRHANGSWRLHEASSYNLLSDPDVEGMVINSRDITERRIVEEELRQRNYDMESILEALPDLYFRFSSDGTIIDYRVGSSTFLYAPPEVFMGKKIQDMLPPELGERTGKVIREVSRDKSTQSFEYSLQTPDGERVYEARMLPALEDEIVTIIRDITERKQAERLAEAQRDMAIKLAGTSDLTEALKIFLRAALEITGMESGGIFLVDTESGDLDLACSEGLSEAFTSKVEHYDADSVNARMVKAGEPLYTKYRGLDLPRADLLSMEGLKAFAVVPIKSEGRVIGCVGAASHIFDELPKHARDALEILSSQIGQAIEHAILVSSLQESEENYRITFESTGTAMVIIGVDGTIIDANQEIQKLLGYKRDDVVDKKKYMEFVHPEDREMIKRYSLLLLKGETPGPVRYEARTVRRDGRVLNTIINVSVLPGMGKSVASIVDITDKKSYELELEMRAAQLRDFLDIAAHELRHPATLMQGYAVTLEEYGEEMKGEELTSSLAAIVRGAEKLTSVVNDLLDVSRIERGPLSLEKREEELAPLIQAAVGEMEARLGEDRIEVSVEEALGTTVVDPEQFTRLLIILLDNAVKYSPPHSPIEVRVENRHRDVLVSVLDRGRGIPEGQRRKIFNRFFQTEEVLHHSGPGLGLGLYIGKRIVDAHGGRIWYESREGGGSIFRISIPSAAARNNL